jgi:COMPASS component SWD3
VEVCVVLLRGQWNIADAIAGADRSVKVWDTLTGKLLFNFEGHLAGVSAIAWNPDNILASGSDDKTIRLWNVSTVKNYGRSVFSAC